MKNDNIDYLTFESLHAEITCNSRSVRLVNIYRPEMDVDGVNVYIFPVFCRNLRN